MRKLAVFAFSFSAAIILAKYVVPEERLILFASIFAAVGFLALLLNDMKRLCAMLTAFGLCAGFLWNFAYCIFFVKPFTYLDGQTEELTAEVADYPQETPYGISVYVKIKAENSKFAAKSLLYADKKAVSLVPGDLIKTKAHMVLSTVSYGKETDYYTSKGIFLIAYQKGDSEVQKSDKLPLKYYPQYLAKAFKAKILELYDKGCSAFMCALLLGDRTLLNKDVQLTDAMSSTGITHVVAVSGMHISFLVGLIMLLTRKRSIGTIICVPIILVFMSAVGNTPSVVRAGVMQMFILFAPIFMRENDNVTSLAAALMLLLFINPYSAGNVGLQLSFASVGGITVFSGKINACLTDKIGKKLPGNRLIHAAWSFIIASFSTTIGALVFTTPLTAIYFNNVSLIAPLTNLLVLWSASYAFCGGLISVMLGFIFAPAGKIAVFLVSILVKYIIFIVKCLSRFPFASVSMRSVFLRLWLIFVYAVLGWLLIVRKRKPRLVIPACGIVIAFCVCVLLSGLIYDITPMTVTALDVGQGQSIILTTKSHTFVVDCGGNNSSNVGNGTADYLKSINRSSIDVLVITHFDSDHIDGITRLMLKTRVGLIAMPSGENGKEDEQNHREEITELAKKQGIEILYVTEDMKLSYRDTALNLYAAHGSSGSNENGIIVLCSEGGFDALVTGDASASVERRLLKSAGLPDIEVMIVGHHGSRYSTSEELLDTLKPETAIISVGYNPYGHPTDEVLDRLKAREIRVLRTDIMGNVSVRSN